MRNAIRCFIACIFPCGALDVIRIVHSNGKVEEISDSHIKASQIMKLHPKHILKKPTYSYSSSNDNNQEISSPKIVIVPPDAELQRGKIYFLMPMPSSYSSSSSSSYSSSSAPREKSRTCSRSSTRNKKKMRHVTLEEQRENANNLLDFDDQYLRDILLEKVSTQRYKRRGRVGVWRPHLESISEIVSNHS